MNEKAALVTGGSKRIGRRIALELAARGYNIALHCNLSGQKAGETAEKVRQAGVHCEVFNCDLGIRKESEALVDRVLKKFPGLSMLVNNASVFNRNPIRQTESACLDRHFEVNFFAPFILSRDFGRNVERGIIINLLDTKIESNDSAYAAYSLSKKALAEFTRMAALEFAPRIRVNAVAPGLILEPEGEGPGYLDRMAKKLPLQKKGGLDYIVEALRYIIDNKFITGQVLLVDGGEAL